jgi:hypothetical protein
MWIPLAIQAHSSMNLTMSFGDVVDQLHNQDCFTDASVSEQT